MEFWMKKANGGTWNPVRPGGMRRHPLLLGYARVSSSLLGYSTHLITPCSRKRGGGLLKTPCGRGTAAPLSFFGILTVVAIFVLAILSREAHLCYKLKEFREDIPRKI